MGRCPNRVRIAALLDCRARTTQATDVQPATQVKYRTRLILQFGSTVSDKTHPRSDVGIAVLLEHPDI